MESTDDRQLSSILHVKRSFKINNKAPHEDSKEETIAVHRFATAPAEVGFSIGSTLNMGNYESAKVEVTVRVPCYLEELKPAYEWTKEFATEQYKKEVVEAREFIKASR